jgi:site-specific DNA recombinase
VREQFEGRSVNTVALDAERAPFIPLAFEWFSTGQYTLPELCERLGDAGFTARPNRRYPKRPPGVELVRAMLRNRYYLGYVTWNGVEYVGRHEPLVTQELFDRVQQLLDALPGRGSRQRRYNHYLKGFVWCDRCGYRLVIMRGKSATGELYFYYLCRGRQDGKCDLPYLRVSHVEQAVEAHYATVCLPAEFRERMRALFEDSALTRQVADQMHRERLLTKLDELDRQEDRYIDLAAEPDVPKVKIIEKLRAIRDERARVKNVLTETTARLDQGRAVVSRVLDNLERPRELYASAGLRSRQKLNRMIFGKLYLDCNAKHATLVTGDELVEPYATIVYLRRDRNPLEGWLNHKGGVSARDTAFDRELYELLRPVLAEPSSSKRDLVGVAGFEPTASSSRSTTAPRNDGCPTPNLQELRASACV